MSQLFSSQFFTLFAIIALGVTLGSFRLGGIALGSAGVFFVALVFGHFKCTVSHELTELGLVLFVYAVGLQAGPRFFSVLRRRGAAFLAVGLGSTAVGALAAIGLAKWFGLSANLAAGLYSGATTCTPGLAAALEAVRRMTGDPGSAETIEAVNATSVGYGAAYPFSVVCVVLLVQLLPRLLRTPAKTAAAAFRAEEETHTPPLDECAFRVTNRNCAGRTVEELQALHLSNAVLCRIKHEGEIYPVKPETTLRLGDTVLAVGTPEELAKLEAVLGDVVVEPMQDPSGKVTSELLLVSRKDVVGKSFRELCIWERFGVVVTRLRRENVELTPRGDVRLEPGDVLRVVGTRRDIRALADALGREERRLAETSFVPFAAGIALGAAVGQIPITLPGGLEVRLGMGGGAFLVALLLGHLGTIGPVRVYVPNAAKYFARELGLVIFLAGAGAGAGQRFVPILREAGGQLIMAGALVTLATVVTALFIIYALCRWNLLYGAGALSACMTNPPGLAAATALTDSDAAPVGFASVYPVALIAKILFAPLVYLLLRM